MHPFLDGPRPIAIAHRGGSLEAPENTMEAFEEAATLGYRYLETDAQLTADGVVVGFHDDRVDRVSDHEGPLSEWAWDDLRHVEVRGDQLTSAHASEAGRIASIAQLLERFPDHRFNLDAKTDVVVEPLIDAIAEADAFDRVCVGSFSDARLRRARALASGDLCTSLGPRAIGVQVLRSYGAPLPRPPGEALQVPTSRKGIPVLTERLIEASHRDGFAVHVWTIDDPVEMERLLDLGVDGIMTDRPSVLKNIFDARGLTL